MTSEHPSGYANDQSTEHLFVDNLTFIQYLQYMNFRSPTSSGPSKEPWVDASWLAFDTVTFDSTTDEATGRRGQVRTTLPTQGIFCQLRHSVTILKTLGQELIFAYF